VPLKINYVSIMRLAQKAAESVAMKDVFATAGRRRAPPRPQGVPDPLRIIDLDAPLRRDQQLPRRRPVHDRGSRNARQNPPEGDGCSTSARSGDGWRAGRENPV
jgi:hypothetical protein